MQVLPNQYKKSFIPKVTMVIAHFTQSKINKRRLSIRKFATILSNFKKLMYAELTS